MAQLFMPGSSSHFVRWHLRGKFAVMERLFCTFITPTTKLIDIGCGDGDALVMARRCDPGCELWGLDIDAGSIRTAASRVTTARFIQGDMHDAASLPHNYFDIVHEFGAAFLSRSWATLARVYFLLLRDNGILLWELPQRWSLAHLSYLLRPAPRRSDGTFSRFMRSLSPGKYRFESDRQLREALDSTGCDYEIMECVPLWYFFCRGFIRSLLDRAWWYTGDRMFDVVDHLLARIWPRSAGYYLVIRKKGRAADRSHHYAA